LSTARRLGWKRGRKVDIREIPFSLHRSPSRPVPSAAQI
jgi:hypothetical protein